MSSKKIESSPATALANAEAEAAKQSVYFKQEPGMQFREGQKVSYDIRVGEDGRRYAVNVQIVSEPSQH